MTTLADELTQFRDFVRQHPRLVILTGAGISAGSGIPTYRDAEGRWLYSEPIQHRDYIQKPETRQRYWTRSFYGWPAIRDAQPNAGHRALALLQRQGHVDLLVTQNVDRLHQRAGSSEVIDLHGRLDRVRCLTCARCVPREWMQAQLSQHNPGLNSLVQAVLQRPDGDMATPDAHAHNTRVPACEHCGGVLIPDVVFFGGTVPRTRVDLTLEAIARADALLVIGSSLQVYSGFRFCRAAHAQGKPLVLFNPGHTRADDLATLKFASPCDTLLSGLGNNSV
ncbi:NAD-dependent protein deacetylase [Kineobactrum sediminis]|uniref:protein acetyllysine N-acetyltransferase n=1 Tax=Kineobactrum sediminis TaxID=1905677 RepID=A0A2N5Y1A8_9GAMM|nr:NAD-dependent protein deacetylase [Kineobactrum sediminis]PLW82173.1 NAD-dependent protein deacetylase [Kineobactrum sediminis]